MSIEDLQEELDTLRPLMVKVGMFDLDTFDDSDTRREAENKLVELELALKNAYRECIYLQGVLDE